LNPTLLIALLVGMIFLVVFVPVIVIMVMWLKGYNKRAIMVKQTGETLKNADFKIVKCKVVKNERYGEIIQFFPGSGYDICKRYESKYWFPMVRKGKAFESIVLHAEQDNYRPCRIVDGVIKVTEIDNGEFLLYKDMVRSNVSDDRKLYAIIVVSFVVFALVFGVACLVAIIYMMKMNIADYAQILANGVVPLA